MFNQELFKERVTTLQQGMKSGFRGELDQKIEKNVIDELESIYSTMLERYTQDVKSGSTFPAQPGVAAHPEQERVYFALLDLLERMELDFTQKFVMDFKHGMDKEVAIGKIKISFLDGIRRSLNAARS